MKQLVTIVASVVTLSSASVQLKVPVIGATTLRFIEAGASAIDILAEMNVEQQVKQKFGESLAR